MTDIPRKPDLPDGGVVADAVRGNWADRYAPAWTLPYLRLARADRPAGTWLLYIPCIWGVLLSAMAHGGLGWRGVWVLVGCGIGAFLMRGAGCTWNDITDQDIDDKVTRTRSRPLPSGQVSRKQALAWMAIQALVAFCILLTFNTNAILLGIASLLPVCVYPFAKRFTYWPQIFLGVAFNWGALLGWTAHGGGLGWPAVALYLAGIAWTLFYDTIYAHQDREDDALIGVKSTARLFGDSTPGWLTGFRWGATLALMAGLMMALAPMREIWPTVFGLLGVGAFFAHLTWQQRKLDINDPGMCLHLFRSNRDAGLIFAGFLGAGILG